MREQKAVFPPGPCYAAGLPAYWPDSLFFLKMLAADMFIIADDVPYSSDGRISRTRLPDGTALKIPVRTRGRSGQLISAVRIERERHWRRRHWRALCRAFGHAPYFDYYADDLADLYRYRGGFLIDFNMAALAWTRRILHLDTPLLFSSALQTPGRGGRRIADLGKALSARTYLASPADRNFLNAHHFQAAGLTLKFLRAPSRVPPPGIPELICRYGPEARRRLRDMLGKAVDRTM